LVFADDAFAAAAAAVVVVVGFWVLLFVSFVIVVFCFLLPK
jgi:hypothetical protein